MCLHCPIWDVCAGHFRMFAPGMFNHMQLKTHTRIAKAWTVITSRTDRTCIYKGCPVARRFVRSHILISLIPPKCSSSLLFLRSLPSVRSPSPLQTRRNERNLSPFVARIHTVRCQDAAHLRPARTTRAPTVTVSAQFVRSKLSSPYVSLLPSNTTQLRINLSCTAAGISTYCAPTYTATQSVARRSRSVK